MTRWDKDRNAGLAIEPDAVAPPLPQPSGLHVARLPDYPSIQFPATMRFLPWITDGATDCLDSMIGAKIAAGEEIHALECGSGSSTGYLAQRVTQLISFDHDANWHNAVRGAVTSIGCTNVEWRTEARPYARHLDDYPEALFDIVLIDGRDRAACVEHVSRVLRTGGMLIVDNTERIGNASNPGPYFPMLRHLQGWPCVHFEQSWKDRAGWTPPHRWITSVWCKPVPGVEISFTTMGRSL